MPATTPAASSTNLGRRLPAAGDPALPNLNRPSRSAGHYPRHLVLHPAGDSASPTREARPTSTSAPSLPNPTHLPPPPTSAAHRWSDLARPAALLRCLASTAGRSPSRPQVSRTWRTLDPQTRKPLTLRPHLQHHPPSAAMCCRPLSTPPLFSCRRAQAAVPRRRQ
jgi:hypothetical protein